MKKFLLFVACMIAGYGSFAQSLTAPPNGDNQKASVVQWIGPVSVTINYNSPNVHGPNGQDRKGHIWGELVPYGFTDQGFGTSKAAPWRAGANENTTINFSHDVKIGGKDLKAGTYALFLDVEKDGPWTWILSNNSTSWGSFFYDPKEDALRSQSTAVEAPYTEWLTYGFEDREANSAVAFLQWENKHVPLKIEVANVNEIYIAKMREELRNSIGFDYRNFAAAAQFCVQHNINLEEALTWADAAISTPFVGQEDFTTLQTKSSVLLALGREADADIAMNKAIHHPTANMQLIHQYARQLLQQGKNQKAFEVFKFNREKHPEDKFTTYVGLARGYTALGDKKNAIKNWEVAIKNIPDNQKQNTELYNNELKKLKG